MTTISQLMRDGVLEYSDGYRTRKDELSTSGYRVLRVADVQSGSIGASGADCVDVAYRQQIGRKAARLGDILLTTKGTIGRVAVVPDLAGEQVVYSPQLCYFRVNAPGVLDPKFLRYWFSSPEAVRQIQMYSGSTDMAPYLSLRDIGALDVSLVPLVHQLAIGEVLGALDDKIAANRRVGSSADALRNTLWRAWTVDAPSSPLSSIARFVNGRAFTKDASGTGRVVIRIAELNSGVGKSTVYNDIEVADDHVARPGDFLMAWSGSLTTARWFRQEAIVNQHIFKVIPSEGSAMWAVASAVDTKMNYFREIAADKATTMGHIQRRHLDEPTHWPDLTTDQNALGQSLWKRALASEQESIRLAATRDELLPLLMNGTITVKDAESRVSEEV